MANSRTVEGCPGKRPGNGVCKAPGIAPTELQWKKQEQSRVVFDSQPTALAGLYAGTVNQEEIRYAPQADDPDLSSCGPVIVGRRGDAIDVFNAAFAEDYTAGEVDSEEVDSVAAEFDPYSSLKGQSERAIGEQLIQIVNSVEAACPVPKERFLRSRLVSLEELAEHEAMDEELAAAEESIEEALNRADRV
jgi:hypothetical protein